MEMLTDKNNVSSYKPIPDKIQNNGETRVNNIKEQTYSISRILRPTLLGFDTVFGQTPGRPGFRHWISISKQLVAVLLFSTLIIGAMTPMLDMIDLSQSITNPINLGVLLALAWAVQCMLPMPLAVYWQVYG